MTCLQKIQDAGKLTAKIITEHPEVSDVWYDFNDIPLDELREVAKIYNKELTFFESRKRMCLQLGTEIENSTIFCYSIEVKVKTRLVIEDAIKNI